ncbi:SDR family NAD(P)-dependent oxidoreductase [Sphaerisporangium aureirubrum]|uniref:SDR family NAD(P)-dependent oxidoreductase n=1 Tax=Sphaerisporangium aureirubrum TaxID=1544736 RepID=A0ABW1NUA0_9ACTN
MPTALITGATAGIGAAFARKLAADGLTPVLVARDAKRLDEAAVALRQRYGVEPEVIPADLTTDEGVGAVEERLRAGVDLLVNNAGFGHDGRHGKNVPVSEEVTMLRLHCEAVLRLTMAALPAIRTRGRGGVINVASVAAFYPGGTYSASKAWVVNYSRSLALEIPEPRVHVMALCPGYVRTEFHERASIDISGIPDAMWLSADRVVATAMRDFARGASLSVPDPRYKAIAGIARFVPPDLIRRVNRRMGR